MATARRSKSKTSKSSSINSHTKVFPRHHQSVVWEWQNDSGSWKPYSGAVSHLLERAQSKGLVSAYLGDAEPSLSAYVVNLVTLQQQNQNTCPVKRYNVRRQMYPPDSVAASGIRWAWCGDVAEDWHSFSMDVQCYIEDYFKKQASTVDLEERFPHLPYCIDFQTMMQVNKVSGFSRKVHRTQCATYPLTAASYTRSTPEGSEDAASDALSGRKSLPNGVAVIPVDVSQEVPNGIMWNLRSRERKLSASQQDNVSLTKKHVISPSSNSDSSCVTQKKKKPKSSSASFECCIAIDKMAANKNNADVRDPGNKGRDKKILVYTEDAMKDAIQACRNENPMGVREASRKFGVPKSTLACKLSGKYPEGRKMGPETILTKAEEDVIEDWILKLAVKGFPRKKSDLLNTVQAMFAEDPRPNPFKEDRPGQKWYLSFLRRHPKIVTRTAEVLTKGRAIVTEGAIRNWFQELRTYVDENDFSSILNDPRRILNADEVNFQLCPKTGKVLGLKGWRNVYEILPGNEKETLTVLAGYSAAGAQMPTMVVYPLKKPRKEIVNSVPEGWVIGLSDSGWMKAETFFEYVANSFLPWVEKENITKPVLLLVDGHKTHMTYHLSKLCAENGIILFALLPNATHILQPMDVSVFRPLKVQWKRIVHKWQSEHQNQCVTRKEFAPLLKEAFENGVTLPTVQNGFRTCGLFPFNPDAIHYEKCVTLARPQVLNDTVFNKVSDHLPVTSNEFSTALKVFNQILEDRQLLQKFKQVVDGHEETTLREQLLFEVWQDIKHKSNSSTFLNTSSTSHQALSNNAKVVPDLDDDNTNNRPKRVRLASENLANDPVELVENRPSTSAGNDNIHRPTNSSDQTVKDMPSTSRTTSQSEIGRSKMVMNNPCVSPLLQQHLFWPESPKKKQNKRNKVTMPSAISSEKWRKIIEEKEEKIKQQEELKLRKRQERKERKENKLKEKAARGRGHGRGRGRGKGRGKQSIPLAESSDSSSTESLAELMEDSDASSETYDDFNLTKQQAASDMPLVASDLEQTCKYCKQVKDAQSILENTVNKTWVTCITCYSVMHIRCISEEHRVFYPDLKEFDEDFECSQCNFVGNDDLGSDFCP